MSKRPVFIAFLALAAAGAQATVRTDLLGDNAPVSAATRTVEIKADTHYVNVAQGDVVRFEANGQSFAFNFDGPSLASCNLQQVAPAGMLDHEVTADVSRSLLNTEGRAGHR